MACQYRLVVGLGNPDKEHEKTRHNAGFWYLDQLAQHYQLNFKHEQKFQSYVAHLKLSEDINCYLCKPITYMNLSGQAVQAIAKYHKIQPEQILVAHDEIDLNVGDLRLKIGGGNGGHNGLKNIIQQLQQKTFSRIRIGVGHPGHQDKVVPYVLSKPNKDDRIVIMQAIHELLEYSDLLLAGKEMNKLMTVLNVSK